MQVPFSQSVFSSVYGAEIVSPWDQELHSIRRLIIGIQQGDILCPDMILTVEDCLLVMWMLSRILLLKELGSCSRILVLLKSKEWPVEAGWNGISLSKLLSGWIFERSVKQDF